MDLDVNWEVWLRKTADVQVLGAISEISKAFNLKIVSENVIEFVDRLVVLVYGKGDDLLRFNELLGVVAEIRLVKTTADLFTGMGAVERQMWTKDLLSRVIAPNSDAPSICLFDTGPVSYTHLTLPTKA